MTDKEFIESIRLVGEEWRDVVGWEGFYYISSFGRLIRTHSQTCPTKIMLPYAQKNRDKIYYGIKLQVANKRKSYLIHRLVAYAFISNPNNYQYIDHINGDSTDNRVSNLRWCTQSMNNLNPIAVMRQSNAHKGKMNTIQNKEVVQLKDGKIIEIFRSIRDVEKKGYHHSCVSRVCNNKLTQYHGYEWKFLADYEQPLVNQ